MRKKIKEKWCKFFRCGSCEKKFDAPFIVNMDHADERQVAVGGFVFHHQSDDITESQAYCIDCHTNIINAIGGAV